MWQADHIKKDNQYPFPLWIRGESIINPNAGQFKPGTFMDLFRRKFTAGLAIYPENAGAPSESQTYSNSGAFSHPGRTFLRAGAVSYMTKATTPPLRNMAAAVR